MNLISKKDLLAITGISYGQLYRWKRQRLIPEEWFIKKASYTGQETFFPRDSIISRVQTILQLKDTYSMEQLAAMFESGGEKSAGLSSKQLAAIEEIPPQWRDSLHELLGRDTIGLDEVAATVYLAGLTGITEEEKKKLLAHLPNPIPAGDHGVIAAFRAAGEYHLLILKGTAALALDTGIQVETKPWSSIADPLRLKYKDLFKMGGN